MDESKEKMNTDHGRKLLNPFAVNKPKKRSIVERELETNMTARVTSPVIVGDGVSTSRYGRARRMNTKHDSENASIETMKSPKSENTPVKIQSPHTKQVVSSTYNTETPKKAHETSLDIDKIYQENKSLSCFNSKEVLPESQLSANKFPKVYIRRDLIQKKDDDDDDIILIKDLFSPKSGKKQIKLLESSSKKSPSTFNKHNGLIDNASVVKALDFDGNKRYSNGSKRDSDVNKRDSDVIKRDSDVNKRDSDVNKRDSDGNKKDSDGNTRKKEDKAEMSDGNTRKKGDKAEMSGSKNALFQVEASCPYQLGELAWARMGTFPFWPCIITRDPASEMFVRKKLFGRVEHYILHVTFFADNGRRSWVVDNMLRKYMGPQEFIAAREKFTPEDKKKYSRLYAAYFVSEKKQSLWNTSVEEAEMIKRKPKRLRIDTLNGILNKVRASKKRQRSGKITRTDSDVSLSESLYDSLFSEDDTKTDDLNRSKNKSRNKSLDVSDVVTACLDNMAAKTGNIKIQKQSHMDRWLQKAKSKTPEKVKNKIDQAPSKMPVVTTKKEETVTPIDNVVNPKVDTPKVVKTVIPKDEKVMIKVENPVSNNKKKKLPPKEVKITKVYSLRRSYESQNALTNQSENDEMKLKNEREHKSDLEAKSVAMDESIKVNLVSENMDLTNCNKIDTKNKPIADSKKEITSDDSSKDNLNTNILKDNNAKIYENTDEVLDAINELLENTSRTDSNAVSKQCVTNEKPTNETELEKVFITGTKLEVMDVDEVHEINVKNGDKEHVITDNVVRVSIPDKINFDSPVKTEDSTLNVINGHSPVKIEKEPLIELELESNLDLEAKQDDTEIKNHSSDIDIGETTPPLKRYERVSISENCHLNGDVNNLLTTLNKNYREQIDLEDQNSNLSNKSAKKIVTANSTEKEMDQSNADKSSIEKQDISIEKSDKHINKPEMSMEKSDVSKELNDSSIDDITDEDIIMSEKDILNESGNSESILQIGNDLSGIASDDPKLIEDSISISLTNSTKSESILETSKNEAHINYHEMKSYQNTSFSNSDESKPFLDNTSVDCLDSATATVNNDNFFREVYLNKPPDLSPDSVAAKANLLLNVKSNGIDYEEDSDEEPSPEYEPFGKEITEDFRQHMKCIESCITDKKDEKQLVKVCNELAVLEDSKTKLVDIRSSISITSPNKVVMNDSLRSSMDEAQKIIKQERIKSDLSPRDNFMGVSSESIQTNKLYTAKEHINETRNGKIKRKSVLDEIPTKIDLTKATDRYIARKDKDEILDGLNTTKKSIEHRLNSSLYKKKHILSLNKEKSRTENIRLNTDSKEAIVINDNTMNPRYKTIDQIENIIKSKPKRLPLENGEVCIPEIGENNYHTRKEIDTLDQNDDDFDIENASVSSEDSEVSLTQNNVPARRSLRSRPEKKGGLEDPEFLTYMELRQDDLAEEHPELSRDDIVSYLYKTYTYAQNLKSDVELDESPLVTKIKQEDTTPPRKKINKLQIQPKNTIENFFRVKYENAKKIDYGERFESAGTSDSNEDITPKREIHSISPVDSGIGNSKDSNESDTPKRKTKSESPTRDLTTEITKDVKVELMNYGIKQEDTSSPITSKSLRKKTKPPRVFESVDLKKYAKVFEKSLDKRIPIVVISPIKDERNNRIKHKQDTEMKREHDTKTKIEQDKIQCEPDTETKLAQDPKTKRKLDTETKYEQDTETKPERDTKLKHKLDTETKQDTETKPERDTEMKHKLDTETKYEQDTEIKHERDTETKHEQDTETKDERDTVTESRDSDSELPLRQLRSKVIQKNKPLEVKKEITKLKDVVADTESASSDSEPLVKLKPKKVDKSIEGSYEDPEFVKYLLLKEDAIIDDNPQLSNNEIKAYLYKTWIYENSSKSDIKKSEDTEISNLVKGVNQESAVTQKKLKRKPKTEKVIDVDEVIPKEKPKRKTVSHYYNEAYLSDIEDELEIFEIFKDKKSPITVVSKTEEALKTEIEETNILDEIELYFKQLTSPKPSVFKGLIREKVCEICENISNLIKCKGCNGTFHYDCVNTVVKTIETPTASKGRKKKKKTGRRPKTLEDSENSDERSHDVSEENTSMEDIAEIITIDAATLESHLEAKMKELLDKTKLDYDSYSSDDGIDWADTVAGKCEIVDVKLKRKTPPIDYSNFKCNNCQKHDTPVCFVCKSAVSKTDVKTRQKCNVMHCNNYYHLECLDHWPQTQFNGEWTRNNKKSERFEALTCPRHVCHTCVSDDPRGCKTRFSGDKLARCVRCPATYHSFNKCLPAGSQILTASLIICPRHYEHRPGKVPCHVNTGWCFICALGGSLICCEYCPTSFHAECLNIKPPEGNYMCEDCETGRLPLYGEMVWVKLGHYRWWPGVILHPSEIPDNIMAVTHGLGEFIVRFFGQYDHYWVNRGRVFPFQEGDSGRVSSQRSKIDADFTLAMEHAHKAFEILKAAEPDDEESLDIASSLLPPHYVKLKCNKPIGSLLGRKVEDPSLSLTQCECNPAEIEPCGPHSQCLNRVLLTECGPTCRAGERCNNRAFERRLYPKLTPYKASHRGWGLKTLEDIKAGQFVIEYVGELIDVEEFQRRMTRKHEIRDENFYFLTLDKERMIDAGPKGNLARFMNHCCEPNCETQKWTVLGDVRVGLFAIDDIKANSEVTFNYNLECTGIEKKRCLCGARRCSGYIGAKPKQLDVSQRTKNGALTAKRKHTKRKNIEETPSNKNKVKKPLGRPPKPKELTEIEKDLLIINSATVSNSESSRPQSVEEKQLRPLKSKIVSNSTDEVIISNGNKPNTILEKELDNSVKEVTVSKDTEPSKEKLDCKPLEEVSISNDTESNKALQKKLDFNTIEELSLSSTETSKGPNKPVNRKLDSKLTREATLSNGTLPRKALKRKLHSMSIEEVSLSSTEPSGKRQKCDKQIEVGD